MSYKKKKKRENIFQFIYTLNDLAITAVRTETSKFVNNSDKTQLELRCLKFCADERN